MKNIICHDREGKEYVVPESQVTFRPSVYGLLIQDEKILLVPNWDGYDFPGGGMEKDETVIDTLCREFTEETGLTIEPDELLHVGNNFYHSRTLDAYWNATLIYFAVKNPRGTISTDGFDEHEKGYAKQAEWIPLSEAPNLKFYNGVDSPALIAKAAQALRKASKDS